MRLLSIVLVIPLHNRNSLFQPVYQPSFVSFLNSQKGVQVFSRTISPKSTRQGLYTTQGMFNYEFPVDSYDKYSLVLSILTVSFGLHIGK